MTMPVASEASCSSPPLFIGDVYPSQSGKHPTISYRVPGTDWYIPFVFCDAYKSDSHAFRYACLQCRRAKEADKKAGPIARAKVVLLSETFGSFEADPSTPALHCCEYQTLERCSYSRTIDAKRAKRKRPGSKDGNASVRALEEKELQASTSRQPHMLKMPRPGHEEYLRRKARRLEIAAHSTLPDLLIAFKYDTYLFDADGVLWRSNEPVPGAVRFIDELLQRGKKVLIVTNNSTKSTAAYMQKVKELGFGQLSEENVISPNVVMVDYFKRNPRFTSKGVYTIGSEGVTEMLQQQLGVQTFGDGPDPVPAEATFLESVDVAREASAVVVGYDVHISYAKIMKAANYLRDADCGFFITNEDGTFPGRDKSRTIPGTGCITAAIRAAALPRQPIVFGKPSEQLAEYVKAHFDLDPRKAIMFGDRLDTDIKFGHQLGVATCWMRTGVHSAAEVERAKAGEDKDLVPHYTFSFEEFYAKPVF